MIAGTTTPDNHNYQAYVGCGGEITKLQFQAASHYRALGCLASLPILRHVGPAIAEVSSVHLPDVFAGETSDPAPAPASARRRVGVAAPLSSPETLRLYAGDWANFCRWCRASGRSALPAAPGTVATYLLEEAACTGRSALARRKAAIAAAHRAQGLFVPALDRAALAALRAACRAGPAPPQRNARPMPARLRRLAAACPGDLAGLRDRALLLLAAATARDTGTATRVPVALLLMLDVEHVRLEAGGIALRVKSRADDEAPQWVVRIARSDIPAACAGRALEDWLRASSTRFGPVFRKVDRWGNVEHTRLGPDGFRRIVKRREAQGRGRGQPDAHRGAP